MDHDTRLQGIMAVDMVSIFGNSVVRMIQVATVGEHHEREQNTDNVQDRQQHT